MPEVQTGEDELRAAGLRVTDQRLAVLAAARAGDHATVELIAEGARAQLGSISTQAVYDVLAAFARAGLVRRLEPAGSPARFETRVGDNHHHIVCRSCGVAVDVDCAVGAAPCLEPAASHGFTLDEAEVTFWGVCPDCQSRTSADARQPHRQGVSSERQAPAPHDH
ncbi:MAG: Fur family transcriptional regulator [Solirubrobacteraceae bacterium]